MGHIINPVTYRLSKSKFWISSWNNITKKNYKLLMFEDQNLKKLLNWFQKFFIWKKFNIFISNINFLKFYNKLLININIGIFDYYHKIKSNKRLPIYLNNLYNNHKVSDLYNKGSQNLLDSFLGGYIKYYIKHWASYLNIIKLDNRFLNRFKQIENITKSRYMVNKQCRSLLIRNYKNINKNSYINININEKILLKKPKKKVYKQEIKRLKALFSNKILNKIKNSFNNSIKKNMNRTYNKYDAYFTFSKKFKSILFKHNHMLYNYNNLLRNIKKIIINKKLLSNFNYMRNSININQNFINYISKYKNDTGVLIRILSNISNSYFFSYNYNIISHKNKIYNYNIINKNMGNLIERSYRMEQIDTNNKRAILLLLGKKMNTLLDLKQRFNYNEYRKNRYRDLLKDANWHITTKKDLFINLFLKNFLIYYLKKIFFIKANIIINIYEGNHGLLEKNSLGLKKTMLVRVASEYKIGHFIGILKRKLEMNKNVKGFKIRIVGRYQKKLRNRKIEVNYGRIRPSNINTPISYMNFIIIYKFGTCGIKISYLRNSYYYEIF